MKAKLCTTPWKCCRRVDLCCGEKGPVDCSQIPKCCEKQEDSLKYCKDCDYFNLEDVNEKAGTCRANYPTCDGWPKVLSSDWCFRIREN